ncbi:hypothetical protein GQ53DRAFT_737836 [Thozetella sp. PMI_491]|nr:hypothetical protein GQ53DRAFT_737836 [Thozetella sp. PMI_491]
MATPDLSTLTSSAQIFSSTHTLPQIRAIHKALHAEIDDKAARLRNQVGASYRELLGTADTIVRMRSDMDAVQVTLGRMGGRCGRTVVGAKVTGLERFVREREDVTLGYADGTAGTRSLGAVARARLLAACALSVSRILGGGLKRTATRGDRLVIAAKVLVLSRLLDITFGTPVKDATVAGSVEASRKSLEVLKERLQEGIKRVLEKPRDSIKQGDIVKALSAYSLANSSGARDVLRHFLHVRAQAMALVFSMEDDERARDPKDVLACLQLYTSTLLDVQALVPHKLAEALQVLKKGALLEDESLHLIEGLRLDVYKRWCGDEIQYFTPFISHDDLDGKHAREMLSSWAKRGSEVLLQGLRKTLETIAEFKAIVELRTSVLKLWISEGGKARGFDPSVMLDQIRAAINEHMLSVLDSKVSKLRLVGSEVSGTLDSWVPGTTDKHQSLWEEDSFDSELTHGAAPFAQDVIARLYGRNDAVSKAVTSYTSWYHVIDDVDQIVDQLKRQRWDNDVDEIEDEETIEQRQQLLSKDDPQGLIKHLHASLAKAFNTLDEQLTALWAKHSKGSNKGHISMYLLRILRDVRSKLPELESVKGFGLGMVPSLHEILAADVVISSLDEFVTAVLTRKTVLGRSLWAGEPELPTSPSPGTFRFLRSLCLSMGDAGGDLWSPAAVAVLKQHLAKQINDHWLAALEAQAAEPLAQPQDAEKDKTEDKEEGDNDNEEEGETKEEQAGDEKSAAEAGDEKQEGEEKEEGNDEADSDGKTEEAAQPNKEAITAEQRRDLQVQWLVDVAYLQCCLSSPGLSTDVFKELEGSLFQKTGLDSTEVKQRVDKASQEYWKKTSLLFGSLT